MNYLVKRKITSFLVLCSFTMSPLLPAYADTASDQTRALDQQAKTAGTSKTFHTVESVAFGAAMATTLAIALIPCPGSPIADTCLPAKLAACNQINTITELAGVGADIALGIINNDMMSALTSAMTTGMTMGTQAMAGGVGIALTQSAASKAATTTINEAGDKVTKEAKDKLGAGPAKLAAQKSAMKLGCLVASAGLGLKAAQYIQAMKSDSQAISTAQSSKNDLAGGRPGPGFNIGTDTAQTTPTGKGAVNSQAAIPDSTCGNQSGNNYLKCALGTSAESAAITNNPDALNAIQDAMGGKSLGDLAKGFTGQSAADLGNYLGSNIGLGSEGSAALAAAMDSADKYAKNSGMLDKYTPGSFSSAGAKIASTSGDDMDFNKMMAGMLKSLNPDGTDKKGEDASTIVFRQLDLLPASKIETNKDISLFARIGYRYRKKSADVEQLNWANPANQTATNNTPFTGSSGLRSPGSSN